MKKETEKDAFKKACALSVDGNIGFYGLFKQKKMQQGGGNLTLDVPRNASLHNYLKIGIFLPKWQKSRRR